jgi:phosphate transport system substrate-binding protein
MGKSAEITPRAIVQDSNGAVRQLVSDDPNAIGFISLGLVNENVKALKLGGVAATRENVENGSYNLTRPFLFVASGEPAGPAKEFIDFTLSQEGQKILMNEGLIPTSERAGK